MRSIWFLLHTTNLIFISAAAYVFYIKPGLWLDQAQLYFCASGLGVGLLTTLIAAGAMVFGGPGSAGVHALLGLLFAGAQGYWLWRFGLDTGMIHFIRRALNL